MTFFLTELVGVGHVLGGPGDPDHLPGAVALDVEALLGEDGVRLHRAVHVARADDGDLHLVLRFVRGR